jgi:alpha-D-ribose 1-methylphosphonate 5-triphosphate synthase subunit PhnL
MIFLEIENTIQISTVISVAVGVVTVIGVLVGGISWFFRIVTRVSILETEMVSVKEDQTEIKQDVKEILKLLRDRPNR